MLVTAVSQTLAIGLGKGGGPGVRGRSQGPPHPATDHRRELDLVRETVTRLLVGQEVGGQRQPTPRQHEHQTLVAEGTDQALESHGREVTAHGTPRQPETTVHGQSGRTCHDGAPAERERKTHCGRRGHTALHLVHGSRQMGTPPRRTRTSGEWRVKHPPPRQVALCVS